MDYDKDIRLIIRTGRRIRVTNDGETVWYHIRGIVDDDQVVVRHHDHDHWAYNLVEMNTFGIWYKEGKLS